ncbi:MAG: hypothetical protein ACRD0U_10970 [Acidimicrobiales bacterium]
MSRLKRVLVVAAGLAAAWAASLPVANAQQGQWTTIGIGPPSVGSDGVSIGGGVEYGGSAIYEFQIDLVRLYVVPSDDLPEECVAGEKEHVYDASRHQGRDTEGVSLTAAPLCNGPHEVQIGGSGTRFFLGNPQPTAHMWEPLGTVELAIPPPPVHGLTAALEGRAIALSWSPPDGYADSPPPDFLGYRVRRTIGDGSPETVAGGDAPLSETTFTDGGLPDQGGTVHYQVSAVRRGGDGEPIVSPAAQSRPIPVTPVNTTTTGPGAVAPPPTAPNPPRPRTAPLPPPVQTTQTIGSVDPLDEEVDFGEEAEPGEDEPVLPDDEFATGPVLRDLGGDEPTVDRALLVPVAAGLCLLGWSLHLRYLTRQALATALEPLVVEALDPPAPDP